MIKYALELWNAETRRFIWCGVLIEAESDLVASEIAAHLVRAGGLGQQLYRLTKPVSTHGGMVVSAGFKPIIV